MSRSLRKGPFVHPKLLKKVAIAKRDGIRKAIRTWSRASMITPDMVGMRFEVHNGKRFLDILVSENMVGHKLGEFSPTRVHKKGGK